MKIYKLKSELNEELDTIWNFITNVGIPSFGRDRVEELWERFSEERYNVSFLRVYEINLMEFSKWLCEVEE